MAPSFMLRKRLSPSGRDVNKFWKCPDPASFSQNLQATMNPFELACGVPMVIQ
jgi:hypothetical protein